MLSVISHPASVLVFSSPRVLHAEHDKPLSHTIPDLVRSRAPRSGAISASFSLALSLGFRRGSVASAGGPSKPQVRALEFSLRSPISSYPRGPFTAPPSLSHRRTRHVMCIFFWVQSTDIHRRICVRIAPTRSARARESDALRRCPRSLGMSWSRSPPHASAFSLFTSAKPDLGRILVPQAPQSVLRPLRPIGHIVRLRPVLNRLAARANGLTRRPVERTLPSAYPPVPDSARCCDSSASHCPAAHDPDSDPGPAHTTCGYV